MGSAFPGAGERGLPTALSEAARRLTVDTGVSGGAQVEVSGTFRPLPQLQRVTCWRIGQEAINNAVKHAESKHILLNLKFGVRRVQLLSKMMDVVFIMMPTSMEQATILD